MADTLNGAGTLAVTDTLAVTGWGFCLPGSETAERRGEGASETEAEAEALPFLKSRKTLKFMGKQDKLAVAAAGKALRGAAIPAAEFRAGLGVYLAVGYIPFERADIDVLAGNSLRDGAFSMERFSHAALDQINPLLTFRCLPNMPLFHVSLNFGIQGPSFVTYPGAGQFCLALERAAKALRSGKVAHALVGGVADQENFLVDFHLSRGAATRGWKARDAAAFLCLEKSSTAEARGAAILMELVSLELGYRPHDPFTAPQPQEEILAWASGSYRADPESLHWGPASPALLLGRIGAQDRIGRQVLTHTLNTLDGIQAKSEWRMGGV